MKHFLVLSKEDIDLALYEVTSYLNLDKFEIFDNFLIFEKKFEDKIYNLGYTKKVSELLIRCKITNLENEINTYDWNVIYSQNFSVRVVNNNSLNKKYGGLIFNLLNDPIVKLKNSNTDIEIYFSKDEAFVCLFKKNINNSFESRKSHNRPSPHPSSLHPKLARAMINMLGDVKIIIDPFCGSGGLLIEAGLTNHKITGIDLDKLMIKRCYNNLKYYNIKNFEIEQRDSTDIVRMDYFVTDLPYGKNTKASEINNLYDSFFNNLQFKKAVIGFPDFYDYKKLFKKYKIKIIKEFNYYLHKNLNKKIVAISL